MDVTVKLTVNGQVKTVATNPQRSLLQVLREDLGLTGVKYACGEGQCGACTVLVDGQLLRSCVTPLELVEGKSVVTIEGLARNGELHPVQMAFIEVEAMQCGYCTGGMILAAVALLAANPHPNDKEIVDWMNGNICRCNGYPKIIEAVRLAATKMEGRKS